MTENNKENNVFLYSLAMRDQISRFHEGLIFPKDSERFGKFRNHSADFIILHMIWYQKHNVTEEKIPKMALPDRHHMYLNIL